MHGWDWGYMGGGYLGGIVMLLFWTAVLVAVVFFVVWLVRQGQSGGSSKQAGGYTGDRESALDILDRRYARGEIDREEYEERRQALGSG